MIDEQLIQLEQTLEAVSKTHRVDFIIDTARKILAINPQHEAAHLATIQALYKSQKFEEMHEAIEIALPQFSNRAWMHYMCYLYYLYLGGKEYIKAKEHIEEALHIDPLQPTYYRCLGEIYLINREPSKAIQPLSMAVKLDPKQPEYRSRLALALLRAQKVRESLETADQALKDGTDQAWVYDSVGMIYTLSGNLEKGEELFTVSLRMDPTNQYFQKHLDWVLREKNDKENRVKIGKRYTPLFLRQRDTNRFF